MCFTAIDAAAPAARVGTGFVAGTVVAADTGRPVRRARVMLAAASVVATTTMSDDQGGFSFPGLAAGLYTLSASKSGYLTAKYGEKTPGGGRAGASITLADGQRIDRLTVTIPRAGVITGTVLDEAGDAAFGTAVRALRYSMQAGVRTLLLAGTGTTDDRGVYRIPTLPPGEYIVSVTPPSLWDDLMARAELDLQMARLQAQAHAQAAGVEAPKPVVGSITGLPPPGPERVTGYVPVYFPGTTNFSAASTVALGVSEERSGVDLQLQLVPMARVSGTVFDLDGSAPRAEIDLVAAGAGGAQTSAGLPTFNAMVGADGRFSFDGVAPGQYTLIVHSRRSAASAAIESRWAMQEVTVNGANIADLTLALQRGLSASGVVAFDGPAPPAPRGRMVVMFNPADESHGLAELAGLQSAPVGDNGRFTATDLVPGRYRVIPTPIPDGWTLVSAVFGDRDALDFPLEIKPGETTPPGVLTLSPRQTELSGTLFDRGGSPTSSCTVVVFAADTRYWTPDSRRIQAVRPPASGRFSFKNLPPGTYRLAAAIDVEYREWLDPAFLRELAGSSMPVTLGDGEKKTQDIRVK